MKTASPALPEFESLRLDQIATPVFRPGNVLFGDEALFGLGRVALEFGPALFENLALGRGPGPDLAGPVPRGEVGIRLFGAQLFDLAANPNLTVKFGPIEDQCDCRFSAI